MLKIIILLLASFMCLPVLASEDAHQLVGAIHITNPGAQRIIQNMTIEINHRHPSNASCESAKQQLTDQHIEIHPDTLQAHYGMTSGKINKIVHLSCLPVNSAFQ